MCKIQTSEGNYWKIRLWVGEVTGASAVLGQLSLQVVSVNQHPKEPERPSPKYNPYYVDTFFLISFAVETAFSLVIFLKSSPSSTTVIP